MENLLGLLEAVVFQVDDTGEVTPLTRGARLMAKELRGGQPSITSLFGFKETSELRTADLAPRFAMVPVRDAGDAPVRWEFDRVEGGLLAVGIGWRTAGELVARLTSETLLYKEHVLNLLPRPVVDELMQRRAVQPKAYRECTVLFADVVGFTKLADELDPVTLIKRLDGQFSAFDHAIEPYGLVKIKTIADSYIAAAGVPHRSRSHAVNAALAALHVLRANANELDTSHWKLRIGLHSGPCISGLIGSSRLLFDVWGDAIDMAWRMERLSQPDRVTISASTCKLVQDFFQVTPAGTAALERGGSMEFFALGRLKPELSADAEGLVPNEKFTARFFADYSPDMAPVSTSTPTVNSIPPYMREGARIRG